ncbi:MAG TPA: lactonase family protein [Bryobacteraceae bacterium]|nr:lactonase family protein [Bryobacteraceae bacterium]
MKIKTVGALILFAASCVPLLSGQQNAGTAKGDWIAFIGTYTRTTSKGIYAWRFQPATGKLTSLGLAAETSNPTFLAVAPNQRFLYAANEDKVGTISAFAIDAANGQLKLLNSVPSRGSGPCHVAVAPSGKWVFAANYNSGSAAVFPVHEDGTLGEATAFVQHAGSSVNAQRQSGPHAHSANLSPDGRWLFVADLGLDQILTYRLDAVKGAISAGDPPFTKIAPGSGPRHMAFGKDGRFAYAISEMLSTVTVFRYDSAGGTLQELQTAQVTPEGYTGQKSSAEIAVDPSGKFLYASNRGDSTIAVFRIDGDKGTLTLVERVSTQGKTPRNFAIDPSGAFLFAANQDSGNVVEFKIDAATGRLTPAGNVLELGSPVCVVFAPAR